jgi:hypothetical protein
MTSAPRSQPIADWWWYSCIAVAWVAGMLGVALDLYYRHYFVWPESRMQGRAAAIGWTTETGTLIGITGFSLIVALPALVRHRFRRSDLLAVAVPAACLFVVVARR